VQVFPRVGFSGALGPISVGPVKHAESASASQDGVLHTLGREKLFELITSIL
jgi:hypothetical protein